MSSSSMELQCTDEPWLDAGSLHAARTESMSACSSKQSAKTRCSLAHAAWSRRQRCEPKSASSGAIKFPGLAHWRPNARKSSVACPTLGRSLLTLNRGKNHAFPRCSAGHSCNERWPFDPALLEPLESAHKKGNSLQTPSKTTHCTSSRSTTADSTSPGSVDLRQQAAQDCRLDSCLC